MMKKRKIGAILLSVTMLGAILPGHVELSEQINLHAVAADSISQRSYTMLEADVLREVLDEYSAAQVVFCADAAEASGDIEYYDDVYAYDAETETVYVIPENGTMLAIDTMDSLFEENTNLVAADLHGLDTSGITSMASVFYACENLETVELGAMDTTQVTNMRAMFDGCSSLTTLNGLEYWDTTQVTDMGYLFASCSSLSSMDVSSFCTSQVQKMDYMFKNFMGTELNLQNFTTESLDDAMSMFNGCQNLTSLNIAQVDTSNVSNMKKMFEGCTSLSNLVCKNAEELARYQQQGSMTAANVQASVTILFELGDGSEPILREIPIGTKDLGKESFGCDSGSGDMKFNGWYLDSYCTIPVPDVITESIAIVYADWIEVFVEPVKIEGKLLGAYLELGSDLTLHCTAKITAPENTPVYVQFLKNRYTKAGDVKGVYDPNQQVTVFSYKGINPQCMTDNFEIRLFVNGTMVDKIENYSIQKYCDQLYESNQEDSALCTLLADLLEYGAKAQIYTVYQQFNLANKLPWVAEHRTQTLEKPVAALQNERAENAKYSFKSVGLKLDNACQIYVAMSMDSALQDGVEVFINGVNKTGDGIAYNDGTEEFFCTDPMSVMQFDDVYTIELKYKGALLQKVNYSANRYVAAKWDNTGRLGELVRAMYAYSQSAKKYMQ